LRVKAGGHANDTAAGSGATEVEFHGIGEDGFFAVDKVATAGASASQPTSRKFLRLLRAFVTGSGVYGDLDTPSHEDTITIENAAGTQDWGIILDTDFARAQTNIGAYTVPKGKRILIKDGYLNIDSPQDANVIIASRVGILIDSAPFPALRNNLEFTKISGFHELHFDVPVVFEELTDIIFCAKMAASTGDISVGFSFSLEDM